MTFTAKRFGELTNDEIFEIYKLRTAVFVVEQNCPYQEVDDYDRVSVHVVMRDETSGEIVAYLRVLPANTVFEDVAIGRVIAVVRRKGYGTQIVAHGIKIAKEVFGAKRITLEAQTYARGLYEKLGFVQTSEEFLEDGIPHIQMQLSIEEK